MEVNSVKTRVLRIIRGAVHDSATNSRGSATAPTARRIELVSFRSLRNEDITTAHLAALTAVPVGLITLFLLRIVSRLGLSLSARLIPAIWESASRWFRLCWWKVGSTLPCGGTPSEYPRCGSGRSSSFVESGEGEERSIFTRAGVGEGGGEGGGVVDGSARAECTEDALDLAKS